MNPRGKHPFPATRSMRNGDEEDRLLSLPRFGPPRVQPVESPAGPAEASGAGKPAEPPGPVIAAAERADVGTTSSLETGMKDGQASPPRDTPQSPGQEAPRGAAAAATGSDGGSSERPRESEADSVPPPRERSANPDFQVLRQIIEQILREREAAMAAGRPGPTQDVLEEAADRLRANGSARPGNRSAEMRPEPAAAAPSAGQRVPITGPGLLVEGVVAAADGALSAVGALGRAVGRAFHGVSAPAEDPDHEPTVLPSLSARRVDQVARAAHEYAQQQEAFWKASTQMATVRAEMQRIARERGLSITDVVEKMKPGGDLSGLHQQFNDAVSGLPDGGARKQAMDRALDGYIRHYERAHEELLNPRQPRRDPQYDHLKGRLRQTHQDMEKGASAVPAFSNAAGEVQPSHLEKLQQAVARVIERIKEVLAECLAAVRGSREAQAAPAPEVNCAG
jgi:hypothetical protein